MIHLDVAQRLELWIPIAFFTALWVFMQWHDKLPSVDSIQKFVAVINSRGGNILILSISSIYFFKYSMYIFMDLLSVVRDKTISEDNAFALMAIQFVTTSAFGASFGAALKTMTGDSSTGRKGDTNGTPDKLPPGASMVKEATVTNSLVISGGEPQP